MILFCGDCVVDATDDTTQTIAVTLRIYKGLGEPQDYSAKHSYLWW